MKQTMIGIPIPEEWKPCCLEQFWVPVVIWNTIRKAERERCAEIAKRHRSLGELAAVAIQAEILGTSKSQGAIRKEA